MSSALQGVTPMYGATYFINVNIVQLLLANGADPDLLDIEVSGILCICCQGVNS